MRCATTALLSLQFKTLILQDLLSEIVVEELIGKADVAFNQLVFDSRKIESGDLFIAVKGYAVDGHQFIDKAIEAQASIIVCEDLPEKISDAVTYVKVKNTTKTLGLLASAYYGKPSTQLKLVGVTGTNGKTTTATLLYNLFRSLGLKVGLISTIENKINEEIKPATHTTPDAVALNALLSEMVDAGCDYVFMEVSSHAIHQERIAGVQFAGGVFTNLTHDHLDYHKTFKEYIYAKKKFFDDLPKSAFALTNIDDKQGEVMVQNTKAKVLRYSLRRLTDFKGKVIANSLEGLHLNINGVDFYSRLIGGFNAYNLLAVYGVAILLEMEQNEILVAMSNLRTAEGRFDYIVDAEKNICGIVDYAHTPDALEKVLVTLQEILKKGNQIITVVGCGGDRDKTKRPVMAEVACKLSHQVIFTSDNPRSEEADAIIADMEAGLEKDQLNKILSITDRTQAIKTAYKIANNGDFILVAGKGHEKYQEIKGIKHPFDDKAILAGIFTST